MAKKTFEYSVESHSFTVVKSSFLGEEATWAALDIFLGLVFAYLLQVSLPAFISNIVIIVEEAARDMEAKSEENGNAPGRFLGIDWDFLELAGVPEYSAYYTGALKDFTLNYL